MNNFNKVSNRGIGSFSQHPNGFHEKQSENFPGFEQFPNGSQSNTPKQAYNQSQTVGFYQQRQQQDSGKKKNLSVKSKNYQNSFAPFPRFSSQTSIELNYDSATDVTLSSMATESVANSNSVNFNEMNANAVEHLDIANFKMRPCTHNTQHNHKQCTFYHNSKDRKRPEGHYSPDLCEFAENAENCPNGDSCTKAHNRVEQLYRQEKYKTKFCGHYPHNIHLCEYGAFCSFAHNEQDITIDLIHNYEYDDDFYMFHFKTVWCPFNLSQHDKALCIYAHNWQDYRRKPNVHSYEPLACPNWKSTDFIVNYEDGCPLKEKCTKCHGWKELEYHPLNYKTKHCPSKNCIKGRDCTHYHFINERRAITTNIANRVFKLVPKNRIITGTFKKRKEEAANGQKNNGSLTYLDENTSFDTGVSLPASFGSTSDLPTHEQLKWMNNMIQTMMAAHSQNDEGLRNLDTQNKESHKRRNSVDSPYFGDKKKPDPTQTANHHVRSLFGDAAKSNQQQVQTTRLNELASTDDMYRAILESPLTLFSSRSVRDTTSRYFETANHGNKEELDSATRVDLERLISTEEF